MKIKRVNLKESRINEAKRTVKTASKLQELRCRKQVWMPLNSPADSYYTIQYGSLEATPCMSIKEGCPPTNSSCRTWRAPPGGSWECRGGSCAPGPASLSPGSSHAASPANQQVSKVGRRLIRKRSWERSQIFFLSAIRCRRIQNILIYKLVGNPRRKCLPFTEFKVLNKYLRWSSSLDVTVASQQPCLHS